MESVFVIQRWSGGSSGRERLLSVNEAELFHRCNNVKTGGMFQVKNMFS